MMNSSTLFKHPLRTGLMAITVLVFAIGTLIPGFQAHAQTSNTTASELSEALQDPALIDSAIARLAIPTHQQAIYRDHLEGVWGNPVIRQAFIADALPLFNSFDLSDPDLVDTIASNFSSAWFQEKSIKGLNRLESSDLREFAKFMSVFMTSINTQACAALVRGEMSAVDIAMLEIRVMGQMPASFVRGYLSLTRKSVIAEISDFPHSKTLGLSERMVVDEVLGSKLLSAIDAHTNREQLLLGLENLAYLSDDELCEFNTMVIDIITGEQGQIGEWMLRYLFM